MKAYLIDPGAENIHEVDFDGTEAHMQALLGSDHVLELVPHSWDSEPLGEGFDLLYVGDDPHGPEGRFILDIYPFSGRVLILGQAEDGSDADASIQIDELAERIQWGAGWLNFRMRNVGERRRRRAEIARREEEALAKPPSPRPWQKSPF